MPLNHRPRKRRAGDLREPQLTRGDVHLLVVVALVMVASRSYDYMTGSDETARAGSLTLVERTAPLWAWGSVFGAFLVLAVVGRWLGRHSLVWAGHMLLFGIYSLLSLGIFLGALSLPWLDGVRGASALWLPITVHGLVALRMGPRPLPPSETVTHEVIGGPHD